MINIDFSNTEVNEGPSRIQPGVRAVVITEVKEGVMPFGDNIPAVSVTFKETEGGGLHTENFSMDPTVKEGKKKSNAQWSLERLMSIGLTQMDEATWKAQVSTIGNLSAALVGKPLRVKFAGREYEKDGTTRVATKLPFFRFAENMSVSPSNLTFNEDRDIERLAQAPGTTTTVPGTTPSVPSAGAVADDLPF